MGYETSKKRCLGTAQNPSKMDKRSVGNISINSPSKSGEHFPDNCLDNFPVNFVMTVLWTLSLAFSGVWSWPRKRQAITSTKMSNKWSGKLVRNMVQQMVRDMFSGFWRRIYRNVSHRSFVHFWCCLVRSETFLFDGSDKMFGRLFLLNFSCWSLSSHLFLIAPTWGRFWPILVFWHMFNLVVPFCLFFLYVLCMWPLTLINTS